MTPKLIRVMWQDHCSISEWLSMSDAITVLKPILAETVGWLICDTDEYIIVAGEKCDLDSSVSNMTVIIKSCIIGIKEL